jgi:DNA-binding transcriptional ArsR family regulator
MSTQKNKLLSPRQLAAVSRMFGALSEPSRLALLQTLHDGPLKVNELTNLCAMKQANVSKHLALLHNHHLVKRHRNGTSVRYEIADPVIFSLCNLVCGKIERDTKQASCIVQSGYMTLNRRKREDFAKECVENNRDRSQCVSERIPLGRVASEWELQLKGYYENQTDSQSRRRCP